MAKGVKIKAEFAKARVSFFFLTARLIMLVSIPLEGLKSYGDFWNFYNLASIGRPFQDLWLEFPPLFPILSRGIYLLVGGREHSFIYSLIVIFSIFQAANIYLFQKIIVSINPENASLNKTFTYAFLILGLFYGWAYFDSLAVFCILLSIYFIATKKHIAAGVVIGIGGLVKWFPLLILPAVWKWLNSKKALLVTVISILIVCIGWGILFGISPEFTKSSLIAQGAKGSWETVWALIDGNLSTGNFSSDLIRTASSSASEATGNPAVIPSWFTLLFFGGVGLLVFFKSELTSVLKLVGFFAFTLIVFFLWSPGYSPQWTLYLLPLLLLAFEDTRSQLLALTLVMVNLLEWPILLSRGWFHFLDEIILVRTGIFVLLAILFAQVVLQNDKSDRMTN